MLAVNSLGLGNQARERKDSYELLKIYKLDNPTHHTGWAGVWATATAARAATTVERILT